MQALIRHPDVIRTTVHMCAHGMNSEDLIGKGLVKKPNGWTTNSAYIAEQVSVQCSNRFKHMVHRRVHLINGKAKAAEVNPMKLCLAILRGLMNQLTSDCALSLVRPK